MVNEIVNGVFYVGVDDRQTRLFENLWPLPSGVSYNSYIIKDCKNVLVDTVEHAYGEEFFGKVREVLGDSPVDYLVINHMEPDHSSSITELKRRYPDVKIIGNAKTLAMLDGFYAISDNVLEVKDGESLSVGENTLTFHLTPMVHWPETQMTYIPEKKLLFSGDAFGTFGALGGKVVDEDVDMSQYWDEMYRYYSNIVGKYGMPVEKAIAKVGGFPIEYICSTHGPVWKKHIPEVVEVYSRMSRYEGECGVVVVYGSMYGHTAGMARTIAGALAEAGIKNVVLHDVSDSDMSFILRDIFKYRGLIIGASTYSGDIFPKVESLLAQITLRGVKNRVFGCFGSFSWAGVAVKRLTAFAEHMKWGVTGTPVEMKQGGTGADIPSACKALALSVAEALNSMQ